MTKRKLLFLYKGALIALALLFMLYPGIADKQPQIDSRVMITAIGLDKSEDGKIMLTAALTVASGSEGGGKETTASSDGDTLGEAVASLARALGKDAGLSHCGMVALGRELCESGVKEEICYLVSSGLISDGASVIAADAKAEELIDGAAGLSESAAFSLGSFLSFSAENAQIPMVSVLRFASDNASVGKSAYLPIIKIGPGGEKSGSGGESGQGQQQGGQEEKQQEEGGEKQGSGGGESSKSGEQSGGKTSGGGEAQIASAEKTLIFKDYKAVAEFDEDATLAVAWQDPRSDRGLVKLDKFEFDGEDLGSFTFRMKKKTVSVKAKFDGDKPTVTVKIRAQLETEDSHRLSEKQKQGFTEKQLMDAMRGELKKSISKQIENGWKKSEEIKADPFKYGYRLFKKNAKKYDDIFKSDEDLFDLLELRADIDVLII